jgi:hypothetical protein
VADLLLEEGDAVVECLLEEGGRTVLITTTAWLLLLSAGAAHHACADTRPGLPSPWDIGHFSRL